MKPELAKMIDREEMPSPPTVAVELLRLVGQPEVRIDEITRVISADPALATKLIDYCNSPLTLSTRRISSLHQAVTMLGLRTLRLLSLSFSLMDTRNDRGFPYEEFWRRSLGMAIASKRFAAVNGIEDEDECFLMGLVYHLGLMGIGVCYAEELSQRFGDRCVLDELTPKIEHDLSGTNRFELGACMLARWNFPDSMIGVLAKRNTSPETQDCFYATAERLAQLMLSGTTDLREVVGLRKYVCQNFGLAETQFDEMFNGMLNDWKGYQPLFNFDTIAFESLHDLEAQAKQSMVEISLSMERTIREMSHKHDELLQLAWIDGLTQLKNRTAFNNEVPEASQSYLRESQSFGLMIADIDHFKNFNDTFGHTAGDCILREVGHCLKRHLRKSDHVYRFGGEEFVLLVSNCEFESVMRVGERLRTAIEDLRVDYEDYQLCVTVSMGICWVDRGKHNSFEEIFETADACLFEAKRKGRNRCVVSTTESEPRRVVFEKNASPGPLTLESSTEPSCSPAAAR